MKGVGFSLWLIPENKDKKYFRSLISQLSKKYNTPSFSPHITLLPGFNLAKKQVVKKTTELSRKISPFTVHFSEIAYLEKYFKCLFITVKKNQELITAHQQAKKYFPSQSFPPYQPHLSLVYGNLSLGQKQELISSIEKQKIPAKTTITKLSLVSSKGEVQDWYKIKEFKLK